ncbi:hypothetical protein V5O48_011562 [Marasmius crinis-equi]|uniref:DUF6534 domain-containing protein n=1 Tax=Marasmius crinis-equi TaxID=585013 RepID=A0ABR3F5I7_9AGAR
MLDGQIGALEVGIVVSTALFGVTTAQTYLYYQLFPKDSKWINLLVLWIWFLELIHNAFACQILYFYTGYFILRVHRLSHSWYMPIIFSVLLAVRFGASTMLAAKAVVMVTLTQWVTDFHWLLVATFSIGTFAGVTIPVMLVLHLARQRTSAHNNKTVSRTLAIVDKLILWTIQTCLLNGLLSVLTLVFYITLPGRFAWVATYVVLPRVFSNSFLVNLNSRVKLRHLQEDGGVVEMFPSDNTGSFPHRLGARITVTKEETRTTDIKDSAGEISFHFESGGTGPDTLRASTTREENEYDSELKREPLGLDVIDISKV